MARSSVSAMRKSGLFDGPGEGEQLFVGDAALGRRAATWWRGARCAGLRCQVQPLNDGCGL